MQLCEKIIKPDNTMKTNCVTLLFTLLFFVFNTMKVKLAINNIKKIQPNIMKFFIWKWWRSDSKLYNVLNNGKAGKKINPKQLFNKDLFFLKKIQPKIEIINVKK